jgi:hypothetical protein
MWTLVVIQPGKYTDSVFVMWQNDNKEVSAQLVWYDNEPELFDNLISYYLEHR